MPSQVAVATPVVDALSESLTNVQFGLVVAVIGVVDGVPGRVDVLAGTADAMVLVPLPAKAVEATGESLDPPQLVDVKIGIVNMAIIHSLDLGCSLIKEIDLMFMALM